MAVPLRALPSLPHGCIRLLLVRHGESLANTQRVLDDAVGSDTDTLTENGKAQATRLGLALRSACLVEENRTVFVGSSTMRRAVQTAEIVSKEAFDMITSLPPSDDLVEIRNGKLHGRCIDDVHVELKSIASAWKSGQVDLRVGDDGDNPMTLQDRALRGVQSILGSLQEPASIVLVVGHFWTNRALLALWMGKELAELGDIYQPNAGISVVDVEAANARAGVVHVVGWHP